MPAYVKAHVNQWVTENRDDRQEPMLLGLADTVPDVPLVFCGAQGGNAKPAEPTTRDPGWEASTAGAVEKHAALCEMPTAPSRWSGKFINTTCCGQSNCCSSRAITTSSTKRLTASTARPPPWIVPAACAGVLPYSLALAEQWRPVAERQMWICPPPGCRRLLQGRRPPIRTSEARRGGGKARREAASGRRRRRTDRRVRCQKTGWSRRSIP